MSFDALQPYGPVIESTVRVATWNTWARFGEWEQRQQGIEQALVTVEPDLVFLTEAWATKDETQASRIATRLECSYSAHRGDWAAHGVSTGVGIVSRWPIKNVLSQALTSVDDGPPGVAVYAMIDGPRGPIQSFTAMLDYPLHASATRQAQVAELAKFVDETTRRRWPTIVSGDFNAHPDSDEIRMMTGKSATPVDGLVFYDSWEIAGDGSPGHTWSNDNPLAALSLYPDRRFDYVFSAWPRAGGAGHPVRCQLLGVLPPEAPQLSDHYGVVADLRY